MSAMIVFLKPQEKSNTKTPLSNGKPSVVSLRLWFQYQSLILFHFQREISCFSHLRQRKTCPFPRQFQRESRTYLIPSSLTMMILPAILTMLLPCLLHLLHSSPSLHQNPASLSHHLHLLLFLLLRLLIPHCVRRCLTSLRPILTFRLPGQEEHTSYPLNSRSPLKVVCIGYTQPIMTFTIKMITSFKTPYWTLSHV